MIHVLAFARSGMNRDAPRQIGEERVLHRVLGQRLVAQHPQREPVGGAAVAVVQLGERDLVGSRGQRDDGFVGQVCQVASRHRRAPRGARRGP